MMRCEICNGKKTIIGLGSIIKKCPECSGIGYLKVEIVKQKKEKKS
jgi:DnaJ-class molecular chaperone